MKRTFLPCSSHSWPFLDFSRTNHTQYVPTEISKCGAPKQSGRNFHGSIYCLSFLHHLSARMRELEFLATSLRDIQCNLGMQIEQEETDPYTPTPPSRQHIDTQTQLITCICKKAARLIGKSEEGI